MAICYATFATVQLLTLALSRGQWLDISFAANGAYLLAGAMVFLVVESMFFTAIASERYRRIFAGFLAVSGMVLLLR